MSQKNEPILKIQILFRYCNFFLNDFHYRVLNLDELSSVNISVILNGNVSRLSSCKMPCLVFELMLGSECVSDVRLPHLHSELCRVCLHQRRRWPCERLLQHLQPVRVTETQSMDEPVRRDFLTSSTQHSRISEDTRAVCARSHAEHSGLSMNKTCLHTAVFRTEFN